MRCTWHVANLTLTPRNCTLGVYFEQERSVHMTSKIGVVEADQSAYRHDSNLRRTALVRA